MVVPAYVWLDPDDMMAAEAKWDDLFQAARRLGDRMIAIVNPNKTDWSNGSEAYDAVLRRLREEGGVGVGYVPTKYGVAPVSHESAYICPCARRRGEMPGSWLKNMKSWIDCWKEEFPDAGGIFFDEAATDIGIVKLYKKIIAHARKRFPGGTFILNHGTVPERPARSGYFGLGATLCIFEGTLTDYLGWSPPALTDDQLARSCALVYDATPERWALAQQRSRDHKLGYFYLTDGVLDNPWGSLSSYVRES